jgi:hypothetical protein
VQIEKGNDVASLKVKKKKRSKAFKTWKYIPILKSQYLDRMVTDSRYGRANCNFQMA